jgi:hypothetical protein
MDSSLKQGKRGVGMPASARTAMIAAKLFKLAAGF